MQQDLNRAAEALWARCEPDWPGLNIEVLAEVGSTNTELMQRGRLGQTWPTVLVALQQTAGRGRRGRAWQSQAGDTLTFSLGLPLALERLPGAGGALSLAVGLSLAQALDAGLATLAHTLAADASAQAPATPPRPPLGLKWPNDLWLGQRKLGGILIEATPAPGLPEDTRWVVVGVGLNLRRGSAPDGAAWLERSSHGPLSLGTVLQWVLPALLRDVQLFMRHGFGPLQAAYAQRDVLRGQAVALWTGAEGPMDMAPPNHMGVASGVADDGALLVHTAQGLQTWRSGDVTVRPT